MIEFPNTHAIKQVILLKAMVMSGEGFEPGSEVDKLHQRYKAKGVINFSITPNENFTGTAEDLARELNRTDDWLSDPVNSLISRVGGYIFMKRGYITCTENKVNLADGWPGEMVIPSPEEQMKIRSYKNDIELFEECIDMLKKLSGSTLRDVDLSI